MYKINKQQGYTVSTRKYSNYFIITLNGVQSIKILNHYIPETYNIVNQLFPLKTRHVLQSSVPTLENVSRRYTMYVAKIYAQNVQRCLLG